MSNSLSEYWTEEVQEDEDSGMDAGVKYVKCNVCHGSGLVIIHGQETDCVECEGWGDLEVNV